MKKKPRFPLYVDLSDKKIVIIGGGSIAERRVRKLLPFCNQLTVVSPVLWQQLQELMALSWQGEDQCRINWIRDTYNSGYLQGADLVLSCTDQVDVNRQVLMDCRERNIPVNVCDDRDACDFHFPSLVLSEDMTIGISSGGKDIKKVKEVRRDIEMLQDFRKKIVVGSRESILAVAQSNMVIRYLRAFHPEMEVSLLTMKTKGDKILDKRLDQIGGKGLFVKELDLALMDGRSDLSVHSLKDMPAEIPAELPLVAFSVREDPRDVLVLPQGVSQIDFSKPIGTSSRRRILQLQSIYPQADFASVRGNLQTRLRKLDQGDYGALILAAAGLKRLGLEKRISRYFSVEEVIPSAGQGIIAVQGKAGQDYAYLQGFHDPDSMIAAKAERRFIHALGAGCSSPVAVHAIIHENEIRLLGFLYDEVKNECRKGELTGKADQAENLADQLAARLRSEA